MKHSLVRKFSVLAFLVLPFLTTSCGSPPSREDLLELVSKQSRAGSFGGVTQIKNFKQVDSRPEEGASYLCWVEYDLVYLKSSAELRKELLERLQAPTDKPTLWGTLDDGLTAMMMPMTLGEFEAGHTVHLERQLYLRKWSQGWRLE